MTEPRDLLKGLFAYIEEQLKDVDPRGYRLSRIFDAKLIPSEVNALPGVQLDIRAEGDHIWLRVERLVSRPAPTVQDPDYRDIITVSPNPDGHEPVLNQPAIARRVLLRLDKNSSEQERNDAEREITEKAAQYLRTFTLEWKAWSSSERPRRKTISLYADLFSLTASLTSSVASKPLELVCGIGVSAWTLSYEGSSVDFQYPLLTQSLEISINADSMALEVRPRAVESRVELDAFVGCSVPGASDVEKLAREHLKQNAHPLSPFDSSSYQDVLKLIARSLDSQGYFVERDGSGDFPSPSEHLVVSETWLIFARPQNNNFLVEDLRRLQAKIADGCSIPDGPLALVTPPSDQTIDHQAVNFRGISSRGVGGSKPQELYFPLPYNQEQVTIVQRLERANGVTVQGPPGTGKTHTIANIICHYLASGKKILVTSRGEQALKVLQSKIPEEIRPLTVALLTNDRDGIRQFQGSIEAIQHQVSQLNTNDADAEIARLKEKIDLTHAELASIDARIDEIALTQLSDITVDEQRMRASKMAELVISGQERFSWFTDKLSLDARHKPPLSEEESTELSIARRTLLTDIVYVSSTFPGIDQLPGVEEIVQLHDKLTTIKQISTELETGELLPLRAATPEVIAQAERLLSVLEEAKTILLDLESSQQYWTLELRRRGRNKDYTSELMALSALLDESEDIIRARSEFLVRPIEIPDALLRSPEAREAIGRAVTTGKPFGFLSFGSGDLKKHFGTITVSGLSPSSNDEWAHVQKYVLLQDRLISFSARWNAFAEPLDLPQVVGSVKALREIEALTVRAKSAYTLATHYDSVTVRIAEEVFDDPPKGLLHGMSHDLEAVKRCLKRHLLKQELSTAYTRLSSLQSVLASCDGPIIVGLRDFVKNHLGNESIDSTSIRSTYISLLSELRRLHGLSIPLSVVADLTTKIEFQGATVFASKLRSTPVLNSGEDPVFPPDWRQAWTWARLKTHLEGIEARKELVQLSRRRSDLEVGLSKSYRELVAKEAWLATKNRSSHKVLQALAGYAVAIRRIGQGTGPNATRYRRDAQAAMIEAAGAVPCWIMSHSKVSESMPADIGAFDLVIVDEASQSDLWALPAIVRGKKILVVGDDKQVSPDGGFTASGKLDDLRTRFLSDQPYGAEMTPEKSLYDLASRVFAAQQVMLREHFRCVQPIISYSNREFYRDAIQPLRIPRASERIDPPLVDMLVEGGFRDKQDKNRLEAEAIADEIEAILANPTFAGRTIGVVSLLGFDQAKLIDTMVRERFDAGELHRREFECGDARTFQGSERDIMFLSMVVDRSNCKALSGTSFDQRFNVAASRARDRMYLVRSVKGSDLSDKDLRTTLLRHFEKPIVIDEESTSTLLDLCESEFERDVFRRLTERGYKVTPQVKSGAYRIDMVVEGLADARLAIELDGDEYHGPDRWQHDVQRQRVLERAGWSFWRCFASTWSLRTDEVFQELIDHLTAMQIEPIGGEARLPSVVEKRTWKKSEQSDAAIAI
jgi:very-short-patch-repair endonuclease